MKTLYFLSLAFLLFNLSSCAKCNACLKDAVSKEICTNSVLDRAKAKSECKKNGGEWLQLEKQ